MKKYIVIALLWASNLFGDGFISDLKEMSGSLGSNDTRFVDFIDDICQRMNEDKDVINGIFNEAQSWGAYLHNSPPGYWIYCYIYVVKQDRVYLYRWSHPGLQGMHAKFEEEQKEVSWTEFNNTVGSIDKLCNLVSGVFAHDFTCDGVVRQLRTAGGPHCELLLMQNKGKKTMVTYYGTPINSCRWIPETKELEDEYVGDERAIEIYRETRLIGGYLMVATSKPWVSPIKEIRERQEKRRIEEAEAKKQEQ